jgi:uncharacterized membrane protein
MAAPEPFVASRYWERPFYRPLRALATSCVILAFLTDAIYVMTANYIWVDSSDWLLFGAAGFGVLALIVGLIEAVARRRHSILRPPVVSALLDIVVLVVVIANNLVHSSDGWTSVVPWGIALSGLAALVLILSEWSQRTTRAPVYVEGVA